jgi:hypothetical protein
MKKQMALLILLFFSLCTQATPVNWFHDSIPWPVPDTGQKNSHTGIYGQVIYGQDSDYNINPRSYTKLDENGNELPDSATSWAMVRDNLTCLIWEVKTDDGSINDKEKKYEWNDAEPIFINALNDQKFGGFSNWRMPTVKELMSIVDIGNSNPAIDSNYFPNTLSASYWTSMSHTIDSTLTWGVNFDSGKDELLEQPPWLEGINFKAYLRAVHEDTCYPGESISNLVDNNDETITDTGTGLMWQKVASNRRDWDGAIEYCENLSLAGFSDWRLPSREELRSIVRYDNCWPAIDTSFFTDKIDNSFWSSTSVDIQNAYGIDFTDGFCRISLKNNRNYIRAVRGGQNIINSHLIIRSIKQSDKLTAGLIKPIKWETQKIPGNVKISISFSGGKENSFETITESTENGGEYKWTVASANSVNCVLKIVPLSEPDKGTSVGLFTIFPPPATIMGRVTNKLNNNPIENVSITVLNEETYTDSQGKFSIETNNIDTQKVIFSKPGYQPKTIENLGLKSGQTTELNISLIQYGSLIGKVTVLKTNASIPEAIISIADITVKADALGQYTINKIVPGSYDVVFTKEYFQEDKRYNIDIKTGETTVLNNELNYPGPLTIVTLGLPETEIGDNYNSRLRVSGGTKPYTYEIVFGKLPTGLSIHPSDGTITGKPTKSGSFTFFIRVTDTDNNFVEMEYTITVVKRSSVPHIADTNQNWHIELEEFNTFNSDWKKSILSDNLDEKIHINVMTFSAYLMMMNINTMYSGDVNHDNRVNKDDMDAIVYALENSSENSDEMDLDENDYLDIQDMAKLFTILNNLNEIKNNTNVLRTITAQNCYAFVQIEVTPYNSASVSYAIEEYLPDDCLPSNIDKNGIWNEKTHTITWGTFLDNQSNFLSYHLTCSTNTYSITGITSINGLTQTIAGDMKSTISCNPVDKAIIVMGGSLDDPLWDRMVKCANYAYNALIYRGYHKSQLLYLNSDLHIDVDQNGDSEDDIYGLSTSKNLQTAITTWAIDANNLFIYLIDHGWMGTFLINEYEVLKASELDQWMELAEFRIPGYIYFLYEACFSGSFIAELKNESMVDSKRIIMTSASNEDAHILNNGLLSFSYQFWASMFETPYVYAAFTQATSMMKAYQSPLLDADGDGIANEKKDSLIAHFLKIGNDDAVLSERPKIKMNQKCLVLNGKTSHNFITEQIVSLQPIQKVWATIIPPKESLPATGNPIYSVPEIVLESTGNEGQYSGIYSEFYENGLYIVSIYAQNLEENISIPAIVRVFSGDTSQWQGDINMDQRIDLSDVILGLQMLSDINAIETCTTVVSCNGDDIIDMMDILYILSEL